MRKSDIFRGELDLISNHKYRECTREILDELVPDYFYDVPASSTGKYHPWYSLGYGGLVRHTKAVVMFAEPSKDVPFIFLAVASLTAVFALPPADEEPA